MALRARYATGLLLPVVAICGWPSPADAGGGNTLMNRGLPKGPITFRFSSFANNVKALPPLVAEFQLGACRLDGNGVIKDGKITGSLNCVDQLRKGTRSLTARFLGGSFSEVGSARRLSLVVEITASSHPSDEAAPGLTGTLELQDSPVRLKNGKVDDTVGLGGWSGAVRTHIHGYNNEDPGERTRPPTGGPPNGGQWADVTIEVKPGNPSGTWKSDWGPVTLRVHNGHVTGSWQQAPGKVGKIVSGSFDPRTGKLTFRYSQSWNRQSGTATFQLSTDGSRLTGTWKQSGGNGSWTMTR